MLRGTEKQLHVGGAIKDILVGYPGMLPPVAGYVSWHDATDPSSMIIGDDRRVSQWNDKSGNGLHLTQATAAVQPTWTGRMNNVRCLDFSGGSYMDSSQTASDNTTSRFVVARTHHVNVSQQYVLGCGGGTGGMGLRLATDGDMESTTDGVATIFSPTTIDIVAGVAFVFAQIVGGATNIIHRKDAGSATSASAYSPTAARTLKVGDSQAVTQPWSGEIGEVLIYDTALSSGDADLVMAYLKGKWGTP